MTDTTSATLSLKMTDKWKTSIVKTTETCSVTISSATCCYACEKRAVIEVKCTTKAQNTTANVVCGEETFAVECSPKGSITQLKFFGQYAKFRRHCSVDCGGKSKQFFEVTGILKYSGSVWTSMWHILNGNSTVYNEINVPDLGHLAESYFTFMKTTITVIIIVGVIFLLTYSIITQTGVTILRSIGKIFAWMLWQPIRGLNRI
uniref:Phlebovirus glycoprotein G2 fusion domain-containing protein n=1 Tax=Caenorhabditis japonica TaxID=281687 RepID=A0A8R1IKS8_CAEJA